jgi:hypothetical protein
MIENFIGIYDEIISPSLCEDFIQEFHMLQKMNLSSDRPENDNTIKEDKTVFLLDASKTLKFVNWELQNITLNNIWHKYNEYVNKYSILKHAQHHSMSSIRMQKTNIGGGYHIWHYENAEYKTSDRILTWILYLNDVEEGGETEFLYYHKRIKPKAGRLVLWPTSFTHTHRGNPPLSGEKYILTSWMEFMPPKINA